VKFVLDTNIVIAAMHGDPRVLDRLDAADLADVGIPILAIGELLYGARRSQRVEANVAAVETLQQALPVLPLTMAVVERYAEVRSELAARGLPKGDFDLVIAATALDAGAVLVTHDGGLGDGAISGLEVEDWLVTPSA
jgi:tRNA(fMet)-specific endonuclease VapC